ncbi:uncharacterized protein LACBIDRAFT_311532 [Laccaria bicolor S238N-H82]|uniref:Predicted protein n=1 Tax=Laccaria bicolor (strain S238N-H82 / ATCC MYA-4686) TaxID=486041 RepID=B0CXM0_LACBS|nr:uncharacterized protein LACBIDRAFT_311532 [Laccaria bicolor S238N-H82]EDR12287.1 predicted protein [Laccaria bicolor S238N-H82]|eukprot:XP_001876551.1 predicted protein [Laccaria bicolor S238N-H82]
MISDSSNGLGFRISTRLRNSVDSRPLQLSTSTHWIHYARRSAISRGSGSWKYKWILQFWWRPGKVCELFEEHSREY